MQSIHPIFKQENVNSSFQFRPLSRRNFVICLSETKLMVNRGNFVFNIFHFISSWMFHAEESYSHSCKAHSCFWRFSLFSSNSKETIQGILAKEIKKGMKNFRMYYFLDECIIHFDIIILRITLFERL